MSKYIAGFVGAGHMGGILAGVAVKSAGADKVAVACSTKERTVEKAAKADCRPDDAAEIIAGSDYIFLGVRPKQLEGMVAENREAIDKAEGIFVSMLSGVSIDALRRSLGEDKKIIRIMPNTPSEVGEGMIAYACSENITDEEIDRFVKLMSPAGMVDRIDESRMDIFSVIAACAPAYAYYFADALAKGGAALGLDSEKAAGYVAQMLRGSAKMIMETGKSAEELKNEVCTPGGTTIEGVRVMDENGMDKIVAAAVKASYDRTVGK